MTLEPGETAGVPGEPVDGDAGEAGDPSAGGAGVEGTGSGFHSGFVALVGRPNVGKSTLVNRLCGAKVSITSDKPQTTRFVVRGVLDRPGVQVVFVDTPGLHRPRSALGEELNAAALAVLADADVVCVVYDATVPVGDGDRWVAAHAPAGSVAVCNKIDGASPAAVLEHLDAASSWPMEAWFPLSARTGEGVDAFVEHLVGRMPEGPAWFPPGSGSDLDADVALAEAVREQLLAVLHDELPHSVATRVTEREGRRVRCEILVERPSQKGIVIGHRGAVLAEVRRGVEAQLPPGTRLELHVGVDRNWQRRAGAVRRYGYGRG